MPTIKSTYLENLRTSSQHLQSGKEIITDAPVDNKGKGEAFSPTDLVASALGSCMVTIMGIVAHREGHELTGLNWEVTKVMDSNPRKIKEIIIDFNWEHPLEDPKLLQKLKNAARTCPVALSLSDEVVQSVTFNF
ncbi:OsmC family protein [Echinicola vietnamensis]|uniref:Putative redox protein, regulator of disulfide bond formation n=1 Tax=Echinicola vietnamensis (strain DSM 17526 / LMG 23754 / KMM 6221) TaxID=926556 RepID=L0FUA5_ECHVK|nr:OsmC family protein [Echinicola vietnamensis]AGA76882.1 putative redox protein, regulator of disulfide bond formation [Echinicola vietnamensis DSM 17526]